VLTPGNAVYYSVIVKNGTGDQVGDAVMIIGNHALDDRTLLSWSGDRLKGLGFTDAQVDALKGHNPDPLNQVLERPGSLVLTAIQKKKR
jgi:hypothetical protein